MRNSICSPFDSAEAIQEAMLMRLGLELVPGREAVEMLVVERARQ